MSSWLSRQRKGELQELANAAGLKGAGSMLKDDLVSSLEQALRENSSKFSSNPAFKEFYERQRGSPVKKSPTATTSNALNTASNIAANAASSASQLATSASQAAASMTQNLVQTTEDIVAMAGSRESKTSGTEKPKARRRTIKREEVEAMLPTTTDLTETSKALAHRAEQAIVATPAAVQRLATRVPLPPSPSVVTDTIIHQQEVISSKAAELWSNSGLTEYSDTIRESLSTVQAVQILWVLIEAWGLQSEVLPWDIEIKIPAVAALKLGETTFHLPDLFSLLGGDFWRLSAVWVATSIAIPLLFAYYLNFAFAAVGARSSHVTRAVSRKQAEEHKVDPLTFNVVKGLVTWLVYSQGFRFFGAISDSTVSKIDGAFPGGNTLVLVGAGTGVVLSLYEAVLRK